MWTVAAALRTLQSTVLLIVQCFQSPAAFTISAKQLRLQLMKLQVILRLMALAMLSLKMSLQQKAEDSVKILLIMLSIILPQQLSLLSNFTIIWILLLLQQFQVPLLQVMRTPKILHQSLPQLEAALIFMAIPISAIKLICTILPFNLQQTTILIFKTEKAQILELPLLM